MPKNTPIKIDLNELATELSLSDDKTRLNIKVAEVKVVLAALGQHLRQTAPEVALATVAAIAERAGL